MKNFTIKDIFYQTAGGAVLLSVKAFRECVGPDADNEDKTQAVLQLLSYLPCGNIWRYCDESPSVELCASKTRPAAPFWASYSPCSIQEAFNAIRFYCLGDEYPVKTLAGYSTYKGVTTELYDARPFTLEVSREWAEQQRWNLPACSAEVRA